MFWDKNGNIIMIYEHSNSLLSLLMISLVLSHIKLLKMTKTTLNQTKFMKMKITMMNQIKLKKMEITMKNVSIQMMKAMKRI